LYRARQGTGNSGDRTGLRKCVRTASTLLDGLGNAVCRTACARGTGTQSIDMPGVGSAVPLRPDVQVGMACSTSVRSGEDSESAEFLRCRSSRKFRVRLWRPKLELP